MNTLQVVRNIKSKKSSIGYWILNNKVLDLVSLEDFDRMLDQSMNLAKVRSIKVYGDTAVGTGTYTLTVTWSNRFNGWMLHILDVVGFEGIRIHVANEPKDILGCLGVGKSYNPKKPDFISESRVAYKELLEELAPLMNFKTKTDKKNKTIILVEDQKQIKPIRIVISRKYEKDV